MFAVDESTKLTTVRDWSGWICTVAAVAWNIRQHFQLKQARSEANAARQQVHLQRLLQVLSSICSSITRLAHIVDQGKRAGVRQESIQLAGDVAHLSTYGDKLISGQDSSTITPFGEDLNNILRLIAAADTEELAELEKASLREFCFSATVNTRSIQGRLEKAQELEEK